MLIITFVTTFIVMTITGILTYGGVSGFVVFFVIYPIALQLFRQANLTRRLIPAAISAGCWTFSMYGPGSPSIQNVIPIQSLGTTPTAGGIGAWAAMIASYVLIFAWLEYRSRFFTKKGIVFIDSSLRTQLDPSELTEDENEDLPSPIIAFIPIILILFFFNAPLFQRADGTMGGLPVETSVFIGVAAATILMFPRVKGGINGWVQVFNKGAADSGVAILNTAIVVGFGGVVKGTQGFADLVEALKHLNMHPLFFVMITVAICAGACGSASGGMSIALEALAPRYLEIAHSIGLNPELLHRIASISSGGLDTLPHNGAVLTLLAVSNCTHKDSYIDICVTTCIIPVIASLLLALVWGVFL